MNGVKIRSQVLNEPVMHEFVTAGKEQALLLVFLKVICNTGMLLM
jgi:hypothetical protein